MSDEKKPLKKPVRVGTKIPHDTNEWLDERAFETGLTKSALINLAIENYRKEIEVVKGMPKIIKELEERGIKFEGIS